MKRLLRFVTAIALGVCVMAGAGYALRYELLRLRLQLPSWSHSLGHEQTFRVVMRDGIELATRVSQPRGDGPWPTIVMRNPYDAAFLESWCGMFVRSGYACVYQEARGQMGSGGEWEPMVNEPNDGEDTLRWLVEQSFHDGNIGFYGPSYLGSVQWAMASRGLPPEVKTLVPLVFGTDLYSLAYERGMFKHEILTAWSTVMPGRGFARQNSKHYREIVRHRPHVEIDEQYLGTRLDWYRDYVTSPGRGDPLWRRVELRDVMRAPAESQIPVLMIGGWYDIFLGAQLADWQTLASRDRSHFVIGPWTHILEPAGDLDLPDARGGAWQWELVLDWMGHHLRGEPLDQPVGVVQSYVIGEDRWRTRPSWPPPARGLRLALDELRKAHRCGGGKLANRAPRAEQTVSYTYDPDDPVPMRGGAGSLAFILADGGPVHSVEQGGLCERADVLSFASEVLDEPLRIAGPVKIGLAVSSDAPDTAFTAKLVELRADGSAVNIRDGITSLAYRDGDRAAQTYEPGTVVELEFELLPIEWTLGTGSRVQLDISSSNFPAYHAHPNRAGVWSLQRDAVPARQTLHAGEARASFLELPVIESESEHVRAAVAGARGAPALR